MSADYLPYLETLRRVPDNIVLSVASREIDPLNPRTCLCGWFVAESIGLMLNVASDDVYSRNGLPWIVAECSERFGGGWGEWNDIFSGIANAVTYPPIELAFVERVQEACANG